MKNIIEIMPSNMPQWMWDAIDEGLLARRSMEKVAELEKELEVSKKFISLGDNSEMTAKEIVLEIIKILNA